MAVLVEAISLIIRKDAIETKAHRGMPRFLAELPNATLCMDDDIARLGFMDPRHCQSYATHLESLGLTYLANGKAIDMIVCDQRQGPMAHCDWIEFGRLPINPTDHVSAAWFFEGKRRGSGMHIKGTRMQLHVPDGWSYQGSISQTNQMIPTDDPRPGLELLRREGNLEVYWDSNANREVFIARDEASAALEPTRRLS